MQLLGIPLKVYSTIALLPKKAPASTLCSVITALLDENIVSYTAKEKYRLRLTRFHDNVPLHQKSDGTDKLL